MVNKEKELRTYADKMSDWYEKSHTDSTDGKLNPDDSLYKYDTLFENRLLYFTQTFPATLNWPFNTLKKGWKSINIITSADKFFRIYSWDNEEGGAMRSYTSIIQYVCNGTLYAITYPPFIKGQDAYNSSLYYAIYTFKANGRVYYIVAQHNQYSSYNYYDAVNAFTIDDGNLNNTVSLFKTETGLHNLIGYEWNATGQYKNADGSYSDNNIEFDEATQSIKIPLVYKGGHVTKKFITYRFTGKYFEKVSE